MAVPESMLCYGLGQEFLDTLLYIKGLEFEEKPNYEYLKNQFKNLYTKHKFNKDEP